MSGRLDAGDGGVGRRVVEIAETKTALGFGQAIVSGVLANVLVCLAVWLSLSTRSVIDRVVAVVLPRQRVRRRRIRAQRGEHVLHPGGPASASILDVPVNMGASTHLSWPAFFGRNLVPVTIGNLVGGALLVGLVYWSVYLRGPRPVGPQTEE